MESNTPSPQEIKLARQKLWHLGDLTWKLDITQSKIHEHFSEIDDRLVVVNCSRRLGKSFWLVVLATSYCLTHPNSIVKMIQPEQKMIRVNIRPIMDKIFIDCPKSLKPRFDKMDNIYFFPNGSQIQLAGSDNGNAEKLRGGDTHLALIDEAGFCSDLKYLVNNILMPTTLLTKGRIVLSSTTPPNPEHEFINYMDQAEGKGSLIVKTIDDAVEDNIGATNPRITKEIVADIEKNYTNGRESESFQLEYLCKRLSNSSFTIIPEFQDVEKDVVCEWLEPPFVDRYVSMDIGFKDLTVVIFAYYDFNSGALIIQDEIVVNGPKMTTEYLADLIKKKENALWTNTLTGEFMTPYRRISDNNAILLNDLYRLHGINFTPTLKDNKEAQINQLRMMMQNREIIIHPRCKTVITHLKKGAWKKDRKDFSRSADDGHYDAIDCLIYLVRNLDRSRNPYPKGYRYANIGKAADLFFVNNPNDVSPKLQRLKDQFTLKSSIRMPSKRR